MRLPLTLQLRRSRRLDILLLTLHAGAAVACLLAALPLFLRLALGATILGSAGYSLWRTGSRIRSLTLRADGMLELERDDGSGGEAAVLAQSTVTRWLTVLLLRGRRGRESLTLLPDALSAEDFRVLRLWLRWRAELS